MSKEILVALERIRLEQQMQFEVLFAAIIGTAGNSAVTAEKIQAHSVRIANTAKDIAEVRAAYDYPEKKDK